MTNSPLFARTLLIGLGAGTLALGLVPALPSPIAPAPLAAQSGGEIDAVVGALRSISTMRADFTQTDRQGNVMSGVMTLKRPGKIRFDYGKDSDFLVISNGKSLYVVDYEVSQVERWPIKNSPLGALFDPERDVKRYGKLVPTGNKDVISVEVRDPKKPEFGMINLIFVRNASAPGGWQLTHWVALDAQNHRTRVQLTNQRYGVAVADSTFTFRDPRRSSRRPG
ncbi:outer membrane lipoprotein carrier protein LolA [Erythrobacter sp. sf7]|uniref:Outer membrane lipoprotein carrier protein LolA n=1 Tax=Erythrobacter fulvus TaxID=2987523 RepID=A0ABT5JRU4_9SPHN|nr:outer membrane lipoprotein carrier protein LolA [Erythrobacter fulvus]MDC8755483.1 outer membrane lipoprotein carrier protein LolA [Erythrobacter fulvus]